MRPRRAINGRNEKSDQELAADAGGGHAMVQSRFSDDVSAELPGYVAAADPGTVVLRPGSGPVEALGANGATQLVYVLRPLPAAPAAAVVRWARGADGEAAVQVAAQLSVASGLDLVVTPSGRQATSVAADLRKRGLPARSGTEPAGGIVVAPVSGLEQADGHEPPAAGGHDSDVHLAVVAGTNEASDDMDQWVQALDSAHQQAGQGGEHDSDSLIADSSQQESRHP